MSTPPRTMQALPSREALIRAVASSTAIETGEHILSIETKLRNMQGKMTHFSLAFTQPVKSTQR